MAAAESGTSLPPIPEAPPQLPHAPPQPVTDALPQVPDALARVSDADRERALRVLRESAAEGRVSHDTFVRRMERVVAARRQEELLAVLVDLPGHGAAEAPRRGVRLISSVGRLSAFQQRLRRAWRSERLPQLVLPAPGPRPLTIGRAAGSGLRLNDISVSRHHAQLSSGAAGWTLRDLGSANGTWVNGRRVTDAVPVGPDDQVCFGAVSFRLVAR